MLLFQKKQKAIEEANTDKCKTETLLSDTILQLQRYEEKNSELEVTLMKERESREFLIKSVEENTLEIQATKTELENKCLECEKIQQEHVRLKCELGTILEHYESERMSILKQKEDEMEKLKSELTNEAQKSSKDLVS